MQRWEVGDVDELIKTTLANDAVIKTKMGITSGEARVANMRVPSPNDTTWNSLYIYFYCIPGPDAPGQGTTRIQANPDYDIEVRTLGAPTENSEAIIDRIDELIGTMVRTLTPSGRYVVSARRSAPINFVQQGESPEVFYTRRGATYKFAVVSA